MLEHYSEIAHTIFRKGECLCTKITKAVTGSLLLRNSGCCNDNMPWEINKNSKSAISHFKNINPMNAEYRSPFIPL